MVTQPVLDMEATCSCLACSGGYERLVDFYDRDWVVGHFEDQASYDSTTYDTNGAWQLDKMCACAESSDDYLCSLRLAKKIKIPDGASTQGQEITSEQRKVGVIESNSTPMYAFTEKKGGYQLYPLGDEDEAESAFKQSNAEHLYKIVPLADTRVISGDDYRLNEYETPNTFSPWGTFSNQLQAFYKREDLPKMSPTSYTWDQSQLLCAEYIRIIHTEFFPLMQPGGATGTNEGFDIKGEASGKSIIGEVKNKDSIDYDSIETLRKHGGKDTVRYFFYRGKESVDDVNVVSIGDVLEKLSDSYRDKMLTRMTSYS